MSLKYFCFPAVLCTFHLLVVIDLTIPKFSDMAVILRAVARCETTIEDSTKMMNKKLDDILQKLNDMKNKEPSSGNKEFSAVDKVMPIGTQEDFNRVNDRLDLDVNFHDLMVSVIFMFKSLSNY